MCERPYANHVLYIGHVRANFLAALRQPFVFTHTACARSELARLASLLQPRESMCPPCSQLADKLQHLNKTKNFAPPTVIPITIKKLNCGLVR